MVARKVSKKRKVRSDEASNNTINTTSKKRKDGREETVLVDQSISVAGRPLPEAPTNTTKGTASQNDNSASIVLFYQYKEPFWTETEFQRAMKLFLKIGHRYQMTGRGRMAREGVNCTLTGPSPSLVRGFCQALRDEWGVVVGAAEKGGNNGKHSNNNSSNNNKNSDKNSYYSEDKDLFLETDFKITDGLPQSQMFKSLSIRKTNELVAYGLEGDKAPSIEKFGGTHLTAVDYHAALQDKNTVVIDVRNAYETAIGTLQPPKGGATILDPKLRNSREWPKWLASKETQEKLHGKTVLTFCTGGIRCERATALINQMSTVSKSEASNSSSGNQQKGDNDKNSKQSNSDSETTPHKNSKEETTTAAAAAFQPKGVYHMRGGIERYLKTYPQGGFWSGKNYLFDKRMEQLPELKSSNEVEDEVAANLKAKCCLCRQPWTTYRGQHKCDMIQCGVPVLVCDACHLKRTATISASNTNDNNNTLTTSKDQLPPLMCELCREGYRAPQGNPDLVAMRKRAEKLIATAGTTSSDKDSTSNNEKNGRNKPITTNLPPLKVASDRIFLNRLPLTTRKSEIEAWLQTPIRQLHWVVDKTSKAFYGSCIVRVDVFSKILLAIKKNGKAKMMTQGNSGLGGSGGGTTVTAMRISQKQDENSFGGPVREFLGPFPGTTRQQHQQQQNQRTKRRHRKQQRQQQQPKIFRVLVGPGETWPPPNHNGNEYPPLGNIQ